MCIGNKLMLLYDCNHGYHGYLQYVYILESGTSLKNFQCQDVDHPLIICLNAV